MNNILEELKLWGCDVDGAMERFVNDEELYISCLSIVVTDENFEELGNALRERNAEHAFDCAHTLKGVIANMGLTPMYKIITKIVEPLRNGQWDNLLPCYDELMETKKHLDAVVQQNEGQGGGN